VASIETPTELLILSGLSGSGKTTALRALEDIGFVCVDNLPVPLLETFLRLTKDHRGIARAAIAMDIRESSHNPEAGRQLEELKTAGLPMRILFLNCTDERAITRFKETRRKHPLIAAGEASTITEAIEKERAWLTPFRHLATTVVDTTDLNVHELKKRIQGLYGDDESRRMRVHLMSFGFRHGIPPEADFVFDVRYIPNPYFVEELRPKSGLDAGVSHYVLEQDAAKRVLSHLKAFFKDVLPLCEDEGKASVTIAIGCTGGRHRSVALTEALREHLVAAKMVVDSSHRDVTKVASKGKSH
jgi:RNase adapter protein RapZ